MVEAQFQNVVKQVANLLEWNSVNLFLGCPETALRHPLLDVFSISRYSLVGYNDAAIDPALLKDERVYALCDIAIQSGHIQSLDQIHIGDTFIQSITVAPLERPSGVLGFFLLTDFCAGVFNHGERLLLSGYLPLMAQSLERSLRDLSSAPLHANFARPSERQIPTTMSNGTVSECVSTLSTPSTEQSVVWWAKEFPQGEQELKEQEFKKLERLKNEFISMVSHELRTPLTAIKGYAVLLQAYGLSGHTGERPAEEMTPMRQKEYLEIIMEQTNHLEVLISDLLDISRMRAGRLTLRFAHVKVAQLCQRVVQLVQHRVDQQQPGLYNIRCVLERDLPLTWADTDRVQQVLTNLLENAVKYSPDGGLIEVLASTRPTMQFLQEYTSSETGAKAVVSSPLVEGMIYITVRDQGIGISHQQQSYLFRPFSRLEHPLTTHVPGVGLGLYITYKLVEAMGGDVRLWSNEGIGTSITFTLPIDTPKEASLSTNALMPVGDGVKILHE